MPAHFDAGAVAEAEKCLKKIIELEPDVTGNYKSLAEHYRRNDRPEDAIGVMERAIAVLPDSAEMHHELGRQCAEAKRLPEAKKAFLRAIEIDPNCSEFYNNLGVACQELGHHDDAVKYFKEAIRLRPGVVGVYNNLGVALNEQRRSEEAIECYNKALAIDPDYALAWNNLGNSLRAVGRNEAAVAALETAIRLKPDYPEAFNNIAIAYVQMGMNERALEWYDKALIYRPDYHECHMNRGLQRLLLGDLPNGWADYEWRWQLKSMRQRDFKKPMWDGSPLGGKKILIYWEQGLGDSIQFIRYAKELKDRGAEVIFEGQPPLEHLLARTRGIDKFVPRGSPLPPFDVHAPLLSLPGQCHTNLDNIPSDVPYVFPDEHFVNMWRPRLDALEGLRVGIVWQGNPDHRGDHLRSFPLRLFEPLARIEGVTLVSLQRNHGCEQLAQLKDQFKVVCFDGVDEEVDGFLRTMAIMKNLDLLITADTSVAHVAGAMGIPVWIAIAVASDWRWLRDREDTPWYPTARLFRQRRAGDWLEVFERIALALKERVSTSPRRKGAITPDDRRRSKELLRAAAKAMTDNSMPEAQKLLEDAIGLDPRSHDAHHDLGVFFGRSRRVQSAIACFRRALELQPNASGAFSNIGLAFLQNNQIEEAVAHMRKAVRLGGGSADLYNNLGVALMGLGDAKAAEEFYVKALHLRPDYAAAHCNFARCLLVQGKLEQGWLELEWRWKQSPDAKREFPQPRWTGQPLTKKTLLLWCEAGAGAGHIIQFVRYASFLKARGARVVLECPPMLARLLSTCPGIDEVIPAGSHLPPFDVQAALLSMPAFARTTLHTIPASVPYLSIDAARTERWKRRLKAIEGLKIGIAWEMDGHFESHGEGTIPLECFGRLTQMSGVRLVSLQMGHGRKQIARRGRPLPLLDLAAEIESYGDEAVLEIAAAIEAVDLIVTGDVFIAHLAAAMGATVWLAIPLNGGFRWLLDRRDSPWYPTLRIFRQRRAGDWSEVFDQIADELIERIAVAAAPVEPGPAMDAGAAAVHDDARRLFARGDFAAASQRFRQLVSLRPDWAVSHHDLAVALAKQRDFPAAVEHFRRALELDPSSRAHGNLALALVEKGDYAGAVEETRLALAHSPDSADLNCRMGIALCRSHKHEEAIPYLKKAKQFQPQSPEAHYWLGDALRHEKRYSEAEENLSTAIRLRPSWHEVYSALGICLASDGRHERAIEVFRQTVQIKQDFFEAWSNLGICLADTNRLPEAADAFQHALYLRPDHPETHRNLAICLLLQGKYEQGWLEYEWRLRARGVPRRRLPGNRWDGVSLKGKTLLMVPEQGLGDTIQFIRYAKLAKASGATTILECPPPLVTLLARCNFLDKVVPAGEHLPAANYHVYLLSLPVPFRTTLLDMPPADPYLSAEPTMIEQWAQDLGTKRRPRIGICWQGNPGYGGDSHRSMQLAEFSLLAEINVELVSLQKSAGVEQIESINFPVTRLERFEASASTFDDTAAILTHLDAVVTCDTAVAHLAGAMGMPVFLALSTANDWRWMRERSDSPWYPTAALFRQERPGDWSGVFKGIADALRLRFDAASPG